MIKSTCYTVIVYRQECCHLALTLAQYLTLIGLRCAIDEDGDTLSNQDFTHSLMLSILGYYLFRVVGIHF